MDSSEATVTQCTEVDDPLCHALPSLLLVDISQTGFPSHALLISSCQKKLNVAHPHVLYHQQDASKNPTQRSLFAGYLIPRPGCSQLELNQNSFRAVTLADLASLDLVPGFMPLHSRLGSMVRRSTTLSLNMGHLHVAVKID
jgi:hypothetical protein